MFRDLLAAAGAIALGVLTTFPVPLAEASCNVFRRHVPHVAVVKEQVVIAPVTVAVPVVFFQVNPLIPVAPVSSVGGVGFNGVGVNQAPPAPNGGPPPAKQETETERVDRLVNERLEALLKSRFQAEDDGPPDIVGYTAPRSGNEVPDVARVASILRTNCASCHTAPTNKGNVVLFNASGIFAPSVTAQQIDNAVASGAMPPAARGNLNSPFAVSASDRQVLRAWAGR